MFIPGIPKILQTYKPKTQKKNVTQRKKDTKITILTQLAHQFQSFTWSPSHPLPPLSGDRINFPSFTAHFPNCAPVDPVSALWISESDQRQVEKRSSQPKRACDDLHRATRYKGYPGQRGGDLDAAQPWSGFLWGHIFPHWNAPSGCSTPGQIQKQQVGNECVCLHMLAIRFHSSPPLPPVGLSKSISIYRGRWFPSPSHPPGHSIHQPSFRVFGFSLPAYAYPASTC